MSANSPFFKKCNALSCLIVSVLILISGIGEVRAAEEGYCDTAREGLKQASEIRGLKVRKKIPCLVQQKEEVKKYMLDTINTQISPERLEAEGAVYKALGIIPEDFNYKEGLINLYLDQLAGYYDPKKKHFVMAGWMPSYMQLSIAVHELTHGLQDQYYDLGNFIDVMKLSSDEALARAALIEGDAFAVQTDAIRKASGQKALAEETSVASLAWQTVFASGATPGLREVPGALVNIMMFPYVSGIRFVHANLKKGGYGRIDEIFKAPPMSTEEVLHPEKYGLTDFRKIDKEDVCGECTKHIFDDVLGEFFVAQVLKNSGLDGFRASGAAAGWAGDRVVLIKDGSEHQVKWKICWDSEKEMEEFSQAWKDSGTGIMRIVATEEECVLLEN